MPVLALEMAVEGSGIVYRGHIAMDTPRRRASLGGRVHWQRPAGYDQRKGCVAVRSPGSIALAIPRSLAAHKAQGD